MTHKPEERQGLAKKMFWACFAILMTVLGLYAQANWVTASEYNKDQGELKMRVTVVEEKLNHVPSQSDITTLLNSSKRIESLIEKLK